MKSRSSSGASCETTAKATAVSETEAASCMERKLVFEQLEETTYQVLTTYDIAAPLAA